MAKNVVISLSGGMDSSTLLLRCLSEYDNVTAISFDYGQKHKVELERAQSLVEYLNEKGFGIKYQVIKLDGLVNLLNSALTEGGDDVPEGHYEVIMENKISVGGDEAGFVITRSTLNRNGVFLTSGLYDTGYEGVMAAVMHVTCGPMKIAPGTRVGQYLSFDAEALHEYDGSYGDGKAHDNKYK